jgi:hypothetical protein
MPSSAEPLRDRIRALLSAGGDYERAGRELGIPPGLAHLVATGLPADGSSARNSEPTQQLVNPPAHNPTATEEVHRWIRQRATADGQMQAAKAKAAKAQAAQAKADAAKAGS